MRRALPLAVLLLSGCVGPFSNSFRLSGDITMSPKLRGRTLAPNTILFVVATNAAGIPVAVKKVIDPKLPLSYRMDQEDLVLPGPGWKVPLTVKVYINTHGRIGQPAPGDLGGSYRSLASPPERFISIVVDKAY